ncbi:MAG TPA: hypothetical protein VFN77_00980 [Acetobacteraceae bacterium]|nr:hypothetical protein [Acetobacteraceae bacterium]
MDAPSHNQKADELDRLLNDADAPMQPERVWSLLADLVRPEIQGGMGGTGRLAKRDGR